MQRALGVNEELWYRLGELDSNNFVMVAHVKGCIEQGALERALRKLIESQSILRAHIQRQGAKKIFSVGELNQLPLEIKERVSDIAWLEQAEAELNDSIDGDANPLWRLICLKGKDQSDFIVNFNHLLGDGRTGQLFIDYLLQSLSDEMYVLPQESLAENFEKQLKKRGFFLKRWLQTGQSLKRFLKEGNRKWRKIQGSQIREEKACTKIISRRLNSEKVNQVMQRSREEKTSVTALLAAGLSQVLDDDLPQGEALGISVAIDTRPQCHQSSSRALGYFVSTANLVSSTPKGLGDLARQFKVDLDEQNSAVQMRFDAFYRSLALRMKKDKYSFKKLVQSKATNAALLTNLGKLDMKVHYGDVELKHCFHIPAVHLLDAPYLSLATTTCNEQMQMSFTYPGHLMNASQVEAWADSLVALLNKNG